MQELAGDQKLANPSVRGTADAAAASHAASVQGAAEHAGSAKHRGSKRPMTDEELARARRLRCMQLPHPICIRCICLVSVRLHQHSAACR